MRRLSVIFLALLACACGDRAETTDPKPQGFAVSLPVEPAPGPQVQRLDLPPAALLALKRADMGDIRLYDARNRPLSLALLDTQAVREERTRLTAIPFTQETAATAGMPVSIHVGRGQADVTVGAGGERGEALESAVLVDTRQIADRAVGITLDGQLPVRQPVNFSVTASGDLRTWEPLAEQVLFRPGDGPALLGAGRISLPASMLHGRYLRVAWQGARQLVLDGVTLHTLRTPPPVPVTVRATGLTLANAHQAVFAPPSAARLAAIRVTMTGSDGVVPLRLLGRTTAEAPWRPLGVASLRQDPKGVLLEVGDLSLRQFKLEADARSAGFSQAPGLELQFAPVSILAAFNGSAPYRLAVGNPEVQPSFFAASNLAGRGGPFPEAKVTGGDGHPAIDIGKPEGFAPRTAALWAALLAGAAVLGFAAYKLLRANAPAR